MGDRWKSTSIRKGRCLLHYRFLHQPGKPWLVLFHGFGQDHRAFDELYPVLESEYSLLVPHLPFHGKSSGTFSGGPLQPGEWLGLIDDMLARQGVESAHWMAYSMGAKLALFAYQSRPEYVLSFTLLAPDGIDMNPWYRLATQSAPGRLVLRMLLKFSFFLTILVFILRTFHLLKPALLRFAGSQLKTTRERKLVRNVWLGLRLLWPEEKVWLLNLAQRPIPFQVILGKKDSVMPPARFADYRKRWPSSIRWIELDSGHARLVEKAGRYWKKGGLFR
jgi:pimeloyl-ACP methyl ester carboxylesterase